MQSAKLYKSKPQSQQNIDPLKLSKNPKYDNVKAKLNTGPTVRDVELLTEARAAKLNQEIFKRISAKKLNTLLSRNEENQSMYLPSTELGQPNPK